MNYSDDILQGAVDKHQFCLVDFLFENNDDDEFTKAFFEDKSFHSIYFIKSKKITY